MTLRCASRRGLQLPQPWPSLMPPLQGRRGRGVGRAAAWGAGATREETWKQRAPKRFRDVFEALDVQHWLLAPWLLNGSSRTQTPAAAHGDGLTTACQEEEEAGFMQADSLTFRVPNLHH